MNGVTARLLRWWVRLYTSGLPSGEGSDRRDEIESNHHEHTHGSGPYDGDTAWQVLGRMVRGLPADLAWRLSRPGAERRAVRGGVTAVDRGGAAVALVAYRSYLGVFAAAVAAVLVAGLIVTVVLIGGDGSSGVNRIAFQSHRSGGWDVFAMGADGSDQTRLSGRPLTELMPALSPDGGKIAFASVDWNTGGRLDLYVMDADGTNLTQLTDTVDTAEQDPAWSPDGERIAFTWQTGDGVRSRRIYLMDADGANKRRLTNNDWLEETPTWSPDGARVAFIATLGHDGSDTYDLDIYVIGIDGTGQVRLTDTPGVDAFPTWSPDGERIAFVSELDGNLEIYLMDSNGKEQVRLTDKPLLNQLSNISWSPDGRSIAFASTRDGNSEIYAIDIETGEETRITSDPAADINPSWR